MAGWTIDKTFEFCYGHRVWSQKLNGRYSEDTKCACRHLHGHEGKIQIFLSADTLVRGMVTDFKHTGVIKKFIDETLDHKFIMDRSDPLYSSLVTPICAATPEPMFVEIYGYRDDKDVWRDIIQHKVGYSLQYARTNEAEREFIDGLFLVDFVPTSENLCKWMFDIVNFVMEPLGVKCTQVDWWETPKSRSSYKG